MPLRRYPKTRLLRPKRILPPARIASASWRASARCSIGSCPADRVLRPPTSLQERLALRIAEETRKPPMLPPARQRSEPE
jgi:hypothetical protein